MRDLYDLSILVPGLPFNHETVNKSALGGSESAGVYMAKALAKIGHRVHLFCNCNQEDQGFYDGVLYRPASTYQMYLRTTPHDVAIVQRAPQVFSAPSSSRLNYLWCHDMALGRQIMQYRTVTWNIDKIIVLSEFMKEQYKKIYHLTDDILFKSRNGIDLSILPKTTHKRDRNLFVCAARPERGIDNLIELYEKLLEKIPDARIAICGYNNPVDHLKDFYAELGRRAAKYGPAISMVGHLSKPDLYKFYSRAGVYVYPTPSPIMKDFAEISCISIIEAQACGLPVVASNRGALNETLVPGAGVLIDGDPWEQDYQDRFVDAVKNYVESQDLYDSASQIGRLSAQSMSWDVIAEEWTEEMNREMADNNDDNNRLLHHLHRNNDIMAAKALIERERPNLHQNAVLAIESLYKFTEDSESFAVHYEEGGKATSERLNKIDIDTIDFNSTNERRFHEIEKVLIECTDTTSSILDYGCGHGWFSLYMHNKIGRKWIGVDVDPGAIEFCLKARDAHAKDPNHLHYYTPQNEDRILEGGQSTIDCAILSEVLEHCPDPVSVLEKVESYVKPGGTVIITVPYGPSEYATYNWVHFRNHLWNFDTHDIMDMIGDKPDLSVDVVPEREQDELTQFVGFYLIHYKVDHKPIGQIDMDRKLRIQRPRQTIGASMIAGPGAEETLEWCLKSAAFMLDEIVIADCGMSDAAKQIAARYNARLIPAKSPLETGFDVARNTALDASVMDFVLWYDTDEKIIGARHMNKYLRKSPWNGFAIRQYHFSVDGQFPPDTPVRLFRRVQTDGEPMRFTGCVAGDTLIDTPSGHIPIRDLVGKQPWIYAYDINNDRLVVTKAKEIALTRKNAETLEIELDDGTVITCTPNHPFLMRHHYASTGKYKFAQDLKPGDRLMPMYRTKDRRGYNTVRVSSNDYQLEHHFVYEQTRGVPIPRNQYHCHHIDHNSRNNGPDIRAKRIAGMLARYKKGKESERMPDNHKVIDIRPGKRIDVYCMEVPSTGNFIAGGVVVSNSIHEHPEKGLNNGPGEIIVLSDVHIAHVGYLHEEIRRKRFWRNAPLLEMDCKKYPDRILQKHFLIRDNCLMNNYELEQNGGIVTPSIKERCEEIKRLYREHFLGRNIYTTIDSLQYYSMALQILGEGIEFTFEVAANRDGVTNQSALNQPKRITARFASVEEAEKEISVRLREAAGQLGSDVW